MAKTFELRALITGVDKLSPVIAGASKKLQGFQKTVKGMGISGMSLKDAFVGGALATPFVMATKSAIEFESAMADVKKVVDFDTPDGFKKMGEDILKMSKKLPMAATDIATIVAAGGQSGIAASDLQEFAESAVKMGIAFDTTADEAGDMMAKWRTSFKMNQTEVVALADKINFLSNTTAAGASQISGIVTKIGPLGAVAGLASGEIAAMGATLASVGIQEEVAATGMKNFMLALTAGNAATAAQKTTLKALRLDSVAIAEQMQTDAKGAMVKVLSAISQVDASKQASVLQQMFGKESIGAIAPLLKNLDQLQENFDSVADATKYSGSMQGEYESRSKTTANTLQLMKNNVQAAGISIGNALLPPLNDLVTGLLPIIESVGKFIADNPALVKSILGAAIAFGAIKVAISGVNGVVGILNKLTKASPLGILITLISLAAGVIMANWDSVAPYFRIVVNHIYDAFDWIWGWIKWIWSWTPLGIITNNWDAIKNFFSGFWTGIKSVFSSSWDYVKGLFDWVPVSYLKGKWDATKTYFSGLWGGIKENASSFWTGIKNLWSWSPESSVRQNWEVLKTFFTDLYNYLYELCPWFFDTLKTLWSWSPMAIIIDNWEPIKQFFKDTYEYIMSYVQWIIDAAGWVGDTVSSIFGGDNTVEVEQSITAQAAEAQKTQLDGSLKVKFEGAPPGMRVEQASVAQPGVKVNTQVGYRTVGQL